MQQQLGLGALRLPSGLSELGANPLFSVAAAAAQDAPPDAAEVAAVLQQARRQQVTALDWGLLFQALASGQLQGSRPAQLVAVLSWAADSAREQLEAAAAAGERPSGGGGGASPAAASDVGNPRLRQALRNTLKLSLLFLGSLARGEAAGGRDAQHPAPTGGKRGGKQAKGGAGAAEAAAEALAQLRVRRDALLAAGGIEDALHENRSLLPAVADLRAASRLVRGAAMHCLVHPLPAGAAGSDRTAKELAEACFQTAAGILARTFVAAEERQAHAAAAQTLQDLLGVVAEPKQQAQVLAGAARLVGSVMLQSRRAGSAIVGRLTDRIQQAAAVASRAGKDAGAAALAAQEQDACLHFAVLLAGTSGGGTLQAALLLRLPQLLPLARSPGSSTRRIMLDLSSALLPSVAQLPFNPAPAAPRPAAVPVAEGAEPAADATAAAVAPAAPPADPKQACRTALLAAVISRLEDKDATLRAKALGCLEKHASMVAMHLSAAAAQASSGSSGSGSGDGTSSTLLQALRGRLCDKSPSVRKKTVALLAALLQPAAGLSHPAAAALAGAVLPLAAQLLGVRPDSALHLGEEALKVLSQAVLRLAAASSSAAGVPHLLQLAAGATEPAARAQLQGSVLDLLLPPSAGPPSAQLLLHNLAAAAQQCSGQQLEQLRQAVQQTVGSASSGATAAVVSSAVRACYQQLHSLCCTHSSTHPAAAGLESAQAGALAAGSSSTSEAAEALGCTATALFVLGPFSSSPHADALASLAEARLLLAGLQHVARAGINQRSAAASRLLACTAMAWQQLGPACFHPNGSSSSQPSDASEPSAASSAALSLAHATLPPLQALLLDPGCTPTLRQEALGVLFALPPAAQAPLRLLPSLSAAAAAAEDAAEATVEETLRPAQLQRQLQLDGQGELQLVVSSRPLPSASGDATEDAGQSAEGGSSPGAADRATASAGPQQQAQQSTLVALLDLLGGLASTYEQQKAAFLQQLVAGAAQREQAQQAQQAAGQTSHFGRPLRPASEWWVGSGQPGPGASAEHAEAAQQGGGTADDYMRAEHLAAEHESAAQRYLDSLLEAADTAPACYLPLLERLAGRTAKGDAEGDAEGALHLPPAVQAAALRALGRLALLSESLSQRAVALAEAALGGGTGGGGSNAATEVQAAAVALLADAIEAFPNLYSDRLLLIGRLMTPDAQPPAAQEQPANGPAESGRAGGADSASETAASQQQLEQAGPNGDRHAQQEQQAQQVVTAASASLFPEQREQLARAAAASYCRLLLRNKLKLQGMLGPLGSALAAASPPVAALVQHALRQMLGAAAPKERARLCMALFHQTPPGCRVALAQALVDPARGLLPAAELRGDVLVSQALQALLAAAQSSSSTLSGKADGGASLAAAATLLRAMQPSAKVLAALHTQLQAGGGTSSGSAGSLLTKLPVTARQALQAFVSSHVPAAAGREEGQQGADGEAPEGSSAGGGKRKRAAGGGKGVSAAVQQQLLELLRGGTGGGRGAATWRPPRPVPTATATGAASASAGTSATAPSTSARSGSRPASSSREPASSARPARSRSVRRRSVRSRVLEDGSDSEASS